MKLKYRIFSMFLAVLFMLGAISSAAVIGASAAAAESEKANIRIQNKYTRESIFNTPEDKLKSMTLMLTKYGFELYAKEETGEVAIREIANPENILFTNPYDIGSSHADAGTNGKASIKEQLLSQVIIHFSETTSTDLSIPLYSFVDAAMREQIEMSPIRNGVRMKYVIGQEEMRKLVPRWIPKESFEENILAPLQEAVAAKSISQWDYNKFKSFYTEEYWDDDKADEINKKLVETYPVLADHNVKIYAVDSSIVNKDLTFLENLIKDYCADTYSFEQMDIDHEDTGYEATDEQHPVFKLALEYTLSETGLTLRVSCNSLQYDMAAYRLESIELLPYMGAGNTKLSGYNFFPDGSGALFDYQQHADKYAAVSAKIYGLDYAYHQITSADATYQKAIRMPVFGSVSTEKIYTYTDKETLSDVSVSATVKSIDEIMESGYTADEIKTNEYKRGYVAVIESGESLGTIQTYHWGSQAEYATLITSFNPKPKDSYSISDSISVAGNRDQTTVVSKRKYTGNIRIHYQMLTDATKGAAKGGDYRYYEASWLGMAEAYRDYLISNKILQKIENVTEDIPLYMEVFGALETQKTIATIPVKVMTPLTTFEDILTMYNQLSANGIRNINFKMTGFANGGMYATMPSKVKWESKVGGKSGFRKLIKAANEIKDQDENANLGIYPDFDFAYSQKNTATDSLNLKKDAVKTIDNRYSSKRIYSATQQTYVSFFQLAISPSRYSKFYTKLMKKYGKYGINTMSVGSLGNALNSDFDEDDPYNREDSKDFTIQALSDLSKTYNLMTDSGNAYTWQYVDHIINADIDSSRYTQASASVPFLGVVLHGYIQFAGTPLNQEGDPQYMILKSVENGAGMYFILSYQNTSALKEDPYLSRYYSIDYNIWQEDLVSYYKTLNDLLRDVQTKVIVDHKFLNYDDGYNTVRMLDEDELQARIEKELQTARENALTAIEQAEIAETARVAEAMIFIRGMETKMNDLLDQMEEQNKVVESAYDKVKTACQAIQKVFDPTRIETLKDREDAVLAYQAAAIAALTAYSKLTYYYDQITATAICEQQLDDELAIIESVMGTESDLYKEANGIVTAFKSEKYPLITSAATEKLNDYNEAYTSDYNGTHSEHTVANDADFKKVIEAITENVQSLVDADLEFVNADLEVNHIDYAEIAAAGVYKAPATAEETEDVSESVSTTNFVNNSKVVAVSYGDVDASRNKTYYKTFILNYNNYVVHTVYNGQEYTIPAYGYVVIYHG